MKVVINREYGGFSVTEAALLRLRELGFPPALEDPMMGETYPSGELQKYPRDRYLMFLDEKWRTDPRLVQVVEELGKKAGEDLKIVNVPDGVRFTLEQHDGLEWIAEVHRTWK